jgi:tol-pal system protein YbgF
MNVIRKTCDYYLNNLEPCKGDTDRMKNSIQKPSQGCIFIGEVIMMKKLIMSVSLLVCCAMVWMPVPVPAQTSQSPCVPAPTYQQPTYQQPIYQQPIYQQPSYIQPPAIPYLPPQPQPQYIMPQPQPQPQQQWGTGYWYNPKQMYQYGLNLVYAKQYYQAIQIFQQFLSCYPQSSLADNALYWLGECYYAQKQYSTALWYFNRVLREYPRGNKVPDAMLKIALSYFSMKQNQRGCQMLQELMRCYPKSEPAQKAYRWLNRCGGSGGGYPPCPPGYAYSAQPGYGYAQTQPSYNDWSFPKNY